jgi:predicted kinase
VSPTHRPNPNGVRLVLICGLPGAGKTTLARRLADGLPAVRVCPDEWLSDLHLDLYDEALRERLEHRLKSLAYELLQLGVHVILEFGFWARAERDEIRETARSIGAAVELRYLDVPIDELWKRVELRNQSPMWREAPISRSQLEEWAVVIQRPTRDELDLFDRPVE